jgi:hypothetical protein
VDFIDFDLAKRWIDCRKIGVKLGQIDEEKKTFLAEKKLAIMVANQAGNPGQRRHQLLAIGIKTSAYKNVRVIRKILFLVPQTFCFRVIIWPTI